MDELKLEHSCQMLVLPPGGNCICHLAMKFLSLSALSFLGFLAEKDSDWKKQHSSSASENLLVVLGLGLGRRRLLL